MMLFFLCFLEPCDKINVLQSPLNESAKVILRATPRRSLLNFPVCLLQSLKFCFSILKAIYKNLSSIPLALFSLVFVNSALYTNNLRSYITLLSGSHYGILSSFLSRSNCLNPGLYFYRSELFWILDFLTLHCRTSIDHCQADSLLNIIINNKISERGKPIVLSSMLQFFDDNLPNLY